MADKKLVSYVRGQLQRGFDLKTIKIYLVSYGYKDYEVDEAINEIYGRHEIRHIIHFSPAVLITIISVFLGLAITAGAVFFFISSKEPQQLLDLNLEAVKSSVNQGQDLVFIVDILNLGSGKRYDIFLKHEIISSKTSEVVAFKQETRGIETSGSRQTRIAVPDDAEPGDYVLRSIATYNGNRAVATLNVKIKESEAGEPEAEPQPEPEPEVGPAPQPEPPVEEPEPEIAPVEESPLAGLSTYEALERIKEIAKTDKSEAAGLCQTLVLEISRDLCFNAVAEVARDKSYCTLIQDDRTKDICFSNIARIVERSEICEEISKDSRKDSCYMNFVIDFRDYTVCDKVTNQYLRQSCNSLNQLSQLNQTQLAYYQSLINQTLRRLGLI